MDFLAGYLALPTQRSILSRFHGMPNHATNPHVRNTLENIVRMGRGKIVTHYNPRLRSFHIRQSGQVRLFGVIQVLLRDCLISCEWLEPVEIELSLSLIGLRLNKLRASLQKLRLRLLKTARCFRHAGFRLIQRSSEWALIDDKKQVSLLHNLPVAKMN